MGTTGKNQCLIVTTPCASSRLLCQYLPAELWPVVEGGGVGRGVAGGEEDVRSQAEAEQREQQAVRPVTCRGRVGTRK